MPTTAWRRFALEAAEQSARCLAAKRRIRGECDDDVTRIRLSARRSPATIAAAGPPPGGSSEVKIAGRATLRTEPTTTTVKSSGNEASARSSNGSSPTS